MKSIRFEPIFRAISLPCLVLRPVNNHFLIMDANEAYLKSTGVILEKIVGRCSSEVFPKNPAHPSRGVERLLESFQEVVARKKKFQLKGLRYDIPVRDTGGFQEKYWDLENVPVLNNSDELEYILHMVQDVTPQKLLRKKKKQLQKEAEKNLQQFSHFVDANPEGLYSMGMDGKFLNANKGMADIAEIPLEKLLEMDFLPFCSGEDKEYVLENFHKAISGESTIFEAKFITAKGREVILEISLAPMKSEGQITGAYGIARDLTSLRHSENIIVTKKNYLEANAAFINIMLQNELTEKSLHNPLAMIGEAVDVESIHYYLAHSCPNTSESLLSLHMEWTNDKAWRQKNIKEFQEFPVNKLEGLVGPLDRNKVITINFSDLPEGELKRLLRLQKSRAALVLPIFLKNNLQGLILLNDYIRERQWNEEELSFLQTLAANLTTTFEKRAAEVALKEQQEALRRSEQTFKALVQESADLFAIMDLEGNFKFKSDSSIRVLGTAPGEFIGRSALEFIHPEDRENVRREFSSLRSAKQVEMAPYRFLNKQKQWRWLESTLTNLTADPAIQGVVSNSRDITELRNQESENRQLNERYRLAATATQDLMYDWDMIKDEVIRFQKGYSRFLGHSVSTVNQRHFWGEHIHPDELKSLIRKQQAILLDHEQDHIIANYRFRRADGSYAHLIDRAYIIRDSEGKPLRMVGATSDISDIKAKEEALEIANRRFMLAMKATKEVIWDWNIITEKVVRGKAFGKISGDMAVEETANLSFWFSKIHPEDRERVQLSLDVAVQDPQESKWQQEYRLIKADGEIAHIVDRGYIVKDASGRPVRMVGSALDATESRTAIEKIEQQNKLLRQVAWDQSHLVRAPLARMKMLLDLFELEESEVMSRKEIIQHLNDSYDELDQIVRNIVKTSEKAKRSATPEIY